MNWALLAIAMGGLAVSRAATAQPPQGTVLRLRAASPSYVTAGVGSVQVNLHGDGFASGAVARLDGQPRPTRLVNARLLQVSLTASDVATARTVSLSVASAGGGMVSNAIPLEIRGTADTQPPVITAPSGLTVDAAGPNGAVVNYPAPTASDNSGSVTTTCAPATNTAFPIGATTVTCTARDPTGNTAAASFTVRVVDTQAPEITAPQSISVTATAATGATVTFAPTVRDNVEVVRVVCLPASGTVFPIGATTVECTATDVGNNTSSASFQVTVNAPPPPPTTTARVLQLNPPNATPGARTFTLAVVGENFRQGMVVRWNGAPRSTFYRLAQGISATIPASDIATAGTARVTVYDPAVGAETNAMEFFIDASRNGVPTLRTVVPSSVAAGSARASFVANGSSFVPGTVVRFKGAEYSGSLNGGGILAVDIPGSALTTPGIFPVTVFNPGPNGGESAPFNVTISGPASDPGTTSTGTSAGAEPAPIVTSVEPATVTVGQRVNFRVLGQNFTPNTRFRWGGSEFDPAMVDVKSSTEIVADLREGYLDQPRTVNVTVATTYPSGTVRVSNSLPVPVVLPPAPIVTSLEPSSVVANTNTVLRIRGQHFTSTSAVRLDASMLDRQVVAFVNAGEIAVNLGGGYFAEQRPIAVRVVNTGPTGIVQESAPATIQVTSAATTAPGGTPGTSGSATPSPPPAISLAGMTPSLAPVGATAIRLTVRGSNFTSGAVVRWNAQALVTRSLNATALEADVPATHFATAGAFTVSVTDAAGSSATSLTFRVAELAPSIAAVDPGTLAAGTGPATLRIRGQYFTPNTRVRWGASQLDPATVSVTSGSELTVNLAANLFAESGTTNLTVVNAYPSGNVRVSNPASVTITPPPRPTIVALAPDTIRAGSGNTVLRISGRDFAPSVQVRFGGSTYDPARVYVASANEIGVGIVKDSLAQARTIRVEVVNIRPTSMQVSNSVTLVIAPPPPNPVPTLTSVKVDTAGTLTLNSVTTPRLVLTLSGTGFIPGSVIRLNGQDATPIYDAPEQLRLRIDRIDRFAMPVSIAVFNPLPGGGLSSARAVSW